MLLRMKRTILCFLLLLSFAACHRFDGAKQSLLLIDSLSVSEPERALSLLDSMQAQSDSLPRRLRMKYHFLRVRAKDKAYQSLQSDTIMERVARYYRHHGTANEAMEATYLPVASIAIVASRPAHSMYIFQLQSKPTPHGPTAIMVSLPASMAKWQNSSRSNSCQKTNLKKSKKANIMH